MYGLTRFFLRGTFVLFSRHLIDVTSCLMKNSRFESVSSRGGESQKLAGSITRFHRVHKKFARYSIRNREWKSGEDERMSRVRGLKLTIKLETLSPARIRLARDFRLNLRGDIIGITRTVTFGRIYGY